MEKEAPGFKHLSFPSGLSKLKPIYRISRSPVNITLLLLREEEGWWFLSRRFGKRGMQGGYCPGAQNSKLGAGETAMCCEPKFVPSP